MTKQEIIDWIGNLDPIAIPYSEYNPLGDLEETHIYEKDGKLYKLFFYDEKPTDCVSRRGKPDGFYEPIEVIKEIQVMTYKEVQFIRKV